MRRRKVHVIAAVLSAALIAQGGGVALAAAQEAEAPVAELVEATEEAIEISDAEPVEAPGETVETSDAELVEAPGETSEESEEFIELPAEEEIHTSKTYYADSTLSLTEDTTLNSSALAVYTEIKLNGNKLTVNGNLNTGASIITGDAGELVINGNFTARNTVNVQGGRLTVNGSYTQRLKDLSLNGSSRVTITGDMSFEGTSAIGGWNSNSGTIITVNGNIIYSSTGNTTYNGATWNVYGNVTQTSDAGTYTAGNLNLCGSGRQTLTLQSNSRVASLTPTNTNIAIVGYLNETTLKGDLTPVLSGVFRTSKLELEGHKLTINQSMENSGTVILGTNGSLTINGNLTADGTVNVQGGTLTVNGNYTHRINDLSLNGSSRVTVTGDMSFEGTSVVGGWNSNTGTSISVNGNLSYSSTGTTSYNNATWTVLGNVTQTASAGKFNAGNIKLPKAGSKVTLPNGNINVLTLSYPKTQYTITPDNCYKTLEAPTAAASGSWKSDSKGYWYVKADGTYPKNTWLQISGKWYHFDASGYMQTGWQKIGGTWYYLGGAKDGAMKTGWQKVSGKWYYFASSGAMQTGWQKIGNTWYYFNNGGDMVTGWKKIGSTWYYFNNGGDMKTGWLKSGNTWYFFKSSGAMATGWAKSGSAWYYFSGSGAMQTGWVKVSGKWYYLDSSGAMLANTSHNIGGKTYRFNASGVCTNP